MMCSSKELHEWAQREDVQARLPGQSTIRLVAAQNFLIMERLT